MTSLVTVDIAATASSLTQTATVKTDLNISVSTYDTFIAALIVRASAIIASYCGRTFGRQTVTETFRFNTFFGYPVSYDRGAALILTHTPIVSITTVTENAEVLTGSGYEANLNAGLIYRLSDGSPATWVTPTVIQYQSGFILPGEVGTRNLPYEIEDCCIALGQSGILRPGSRRRSSPSVSHRGRCRQLHLCEFEQPEHELGRRHESHAGAICHAVVLMPSHGSFRIKCSVSLDAR